MHSQRQHQRLFEECPWREVHSDGANCGFVNAMLENLNVTCRVADEACAECSRFSVPNLDTLNEVVASLIVLKTTEIIDTSSDAEEEAVRHRETAQDFLEIVTNHPTNSVIPARTAVPCAYRGSELTTDSELARFECVHPEHEVADEKMCRVCRDWTRSRDADRIKLSTMLPATERFGPRILEWAVGVTTAPRGRSTLEVCLESLARAGWTQPHLFVDGGAEIPAQFGHLPGTWRDRRVGAWANFILGLGELVLKSPRADVFLMIQDDACFFDRENVREYLEDQLWPNDDCGIISLYCSEADTAMENGWHLHVGPWVWGALALVIPNEIAVRLLSEARTFRHPERFSNRFPAQVDTLLGSWAHVRNVSVTFPTPSLVQHIGNTSSIYDEGTNWGPRKADWFAGDLDSAFHLHGTLDEFPEQEFPIDDEYIEDYLGRVERGRGKMDRTRVVICGLCRDIRLCLPRTKARIERLGEMFTDYRVILFENDSNDGTQHQLQQWQKQNDRVRILSSQMGHERFPQIRSLKRAERLAMYRNEYLDVLSNDFRDFDYAIIVDTDLKGGWSYDGIAHTFGSDDWDFVGSYGVWKRAETFPNRRELIHFDAWAFRHVGQRTASDNLTVNEMIFRRGAPMVPIWSCFGGLGVYRAACLHEARYGGADCEHVELHHAMRSAGHDRLFLNPAQLTVY